MRVNIIDGDTLIYLSTYNKKDAPIKSLEDCYNDMDSLLNNIFQATRTTHYLLYLTIGKNFRYNIEPTYKENRKKQEKPPFFYEVRQYLIDNWKASYIEEYESDDLCISTRKLLRQQGVDCFISSPDKDIKKTVGECFDYKKFEWSDTRHGEAYEYFFRSMIEGDNADGVPGLKGYGKAFVDKLFKDNTKYPELVLRTYIDYYNSNDKGIEEYYKSYKLLKIKDDIMIENLIPIPVQKAVESKIIEI